MRKTNVETAQSAYLPLDECTVEKQNERKTETLSQADFESVGQAGAVSSR